MLCHSIFVFLFFLCFALFCFVFTKRVQMSHDTSKANLKLFNGQFTRKKLPFLKETTNILTLIPTVISQKPTYYINFYTCNFSFPGFKKKKKKTFLPPLSHTYPAQYTQHIHTYCQTKQLTVPKTKK